MKILKFGGASVKDAGAVKNVAEILKNYIDQPVVVVLSAIGKTTNALERLLDTFLQGSSDFTSHLNALKTHHFSIAKELFPEENNEIYQELENIFLDLEFYFDNETEKDYGFLYDQVVSTGELLSTKILSSYLNRVNIRNKWLDSRNFIITDEFHREARVNWDNTVRLIQRKLQPVIEKTPVVTQGFIGSTETKITTTLGREGSDYSAAIFAYTLNASEVLIWKDVPGVLNADPKKVKKTQKFESLSYQEAIEMSFYGSKVLHPKTIKPLQNKSIPLEVKSFLEPLKKGTLIVADSPYKEKVPVIIIKENQLLLSLSTRDYSFIAKENLRKIFTELVNLGINMNLMNTSAITFSLSVDNEPFKIEKLVASLEDDFRINTTSNLQLLTIRHYNNSIVKQMTRDKEVLLENINGVTVRLVLKKSKD